jgi:creatinine amidohydrolase
MSRQQLITHATATWPDIAALPEDTVALISLGATEQHGPHLPLKMDTVLGEAFARQVAARLNAPVLLYPTIPFGLSDHHRDFAGTITVTEKTLRGVVDAYVESALRSGFSRVAMLSGHGGNFGFLKTYRDRLRADHPGLRVAAFVELSELADACDVAGAELGLALPECDAHAGLFETSVALHLLGAEGVRDFGDVHGYVAAEPGWTDRLFRDGVAGLSATGVIGDPRDASATAGERFLTAIAQRIARQFAAELDLELRTDDLLAIPEAGVK